MTQRAMAAAAAVWLCALTPLMVHPQEGAEAMTPGRDLVVEYIEYRKAVWETDKVHEYTNERPNVGGLVHAYVRNAGDHPVSIRTWRLNGHAGEWWRQAMKVVWDKLHAADLQPGQMTVLELCGVTEEFQPGKPCRLALTGGNWRAAGALEARFTEDPVRVSLIRVFPDMRQAEVHIRNGGEASVRIEEPAPEGVEAVETLCVGSEIPPGGTAIARLSLARELTPGEMLIVRVPIEGGAEPRAIYSHRRAYADFFPIGTWGADEHTYTDQRRHHIDTCVRSCDPGDVFLTRDASRWGYRAMVHSGFYPNTDGIRSLRDNPNVYCWMPHDEPDWTKPPQWVFMSTEMTRQYGLQKPIMITLCRNVKFFEYAGLADIPCMDHYSVTAPSSSSWPRRYGTRLEETAYYTRDLKAASEPRPIWVWTQGLHLWDERPKRPIPTSSELAAQLILNLSRGAKGILWFTFSQEAGEQYPEVKTAIQGWGRVLELARPHLIGAEPYDADTRAPELIDVGALAAWDRVFLAVTNLDYEIHDEAYPWTTARDAKISVRCPSWQRPAAALALDPDGVKRLPLEFADGRAQIGLGDLDVCRLVVLVPDEPQVAEYEQAYQRALDAESREF